MSPVEARVRAAIELRELSVAMLRQALARQNPDESHEEIEARLRRRVLRAEPPAPRFERREPAR